MRHNKIIAITLIVFFTINKINGQCDEDGVLDLDIIFGGGVIEFSDNTSNSGNNFSVSDMTSGGFGGNDRIYKITLEDNDTLNLFIDLCQSGVTFDASIGIVKGYDGINCNEIERDELIIPHPSPNFDEGGFDENIDSGALCPVASDIETPNFLPIARDVYLDESGDYYIVIDGHTETESGNFTITIGEMLAFSDYEIGYQNDIVEYVQVSFSDNVYRVNPSDWTLTAPTGSFNFIYNGSIIEYDQITDSGGNDIVIEQYLSNPLDAFRYYISSASIPAGSEVTLVPVESEWGPLPVNVHGIPFAFEDTLIIEIPELDEPPVIDTIYNLSADNTSFEVIFSEGVYSSNNQQGVSLSYFSIETNPTSLSPAISFITNGTTAPLPGDDTLIFNISMLPSSGDESVRIRANPNLVFGSSGIAMGPQWSNSILLNDRLPPDIVEYDFDPDSTTAGVAPDASIRIIFDNPIDLVDEANISTTTFNNIISLNYENDGVLGDAIGFNAAINSARDTITVDPDTALIQISRVLLKVARDTIVDANNNIMNEKQSRFNVADIVFPEIQSSSLAGNNEYVLINFSEALWSEIDQSGNIVPSDFIIELNSEDENSNASNVVIEQITDGIGNTAELNNIDAVRLYLGFDSNPSGAESITISPVSSELFDQGNNPLPWTSSLSFDLSDQLSPLIIIKSISNSDDVGLIHPDTSFIITSTEALHRSDNSEITNENIKDYITLYYSADSELINYSAIVNGGKTAIEINPDTILTEWAEVFLKIDSQNDGVSLTDVALNEIETTAEIIRVDDITAPIINSATIDESNTFITLDVSEPVYNGFDETGGLGGLSDSHFELSIVENVLNNIQNVSIDNVRGANGAPLQGGETIIRIEIILSRADASGSEVITVSPSERPIYDRRGNEVSVFLNQKSVNLYDKLSPTVSFSPTLDTLILPSTDFILTFSETIKKYNAANQTTSVLDTGEISSLIILKYTNGENINYATSFNADTSVITLSTLQTLVESGSVELSYGEVFSDRSANSVSPGLAQYTVDDISPPSFDSYSLGAGNEYVRINMSEGVYTDSSGSGALTVDDLNLVVDYGNQNGADLIGIDYLSDIYGGVLSGGDQQILVNLNIVGSTNGTEKVMVHAVSGEIFDGSGNSMSANESTNEYNLSAAPVFDTRSILSTDNSYAKLIFDNGPVFTNAALNQPVKKQDFIAELAQFGGEIIEIQIDSVNDASGNPLDNDGADSIRIYFNFDFTPDGSEIITFSPESPSAIYNSQGVNMDTSQHAGPYTLNDQLFPFYGLSVQDGDINIGNNDTIVISFNEPVRILGGQPLTDEIAKENFIIRDTTDNTVLENYFTIVNAPSPDSVWIIMTQPFGSEHVISLTIKNEFEDFSGNQVLNDSTIFFTVRDNVSPGFVRGSAVIDTTEINAVKNNPSEGSRRICYVDLSINDDVYTDSQASLPVQASDFSIGIIQNGGSVSSAYVENLIPLEIEEMGRDSLRFQIKFDQVPSGNESFFIYATDSISVFDNGFNPMSTDSTSDTLLVYDLRFPTIDTTSIEHDGYLDLQSDSTILVYFSEPIRVESFDYSFRAKIDTINFLHDINLTPDSLTIFLNTPILSYDTLDLTILHIEDTSGNIRESLIERRFFTKAAADFSEPPDDRVGVEDLAIFIDGWYSGDSTKELGPFSGTPPNIRISPDNIFGIDDGMAFTQMWLWSLETFGVSEVTQEQLDNLPSTITYLDNTIDVTPPNNAFSGQVLINYMETDYQINPSRNNELKSNGLFLSNNNPINGLSVVEYSSRKNIRNTISFNVNKNHNSFSEINIKYSFFDENFRLISKGDSVLYMLAVPTEFSLMQNYPNPFNPSTKIRFDLPIDSFVSLIVYDINGRVINQLVDDYLKAGSHSITWHGQRSNGLDLSSGLYFYKIEAAGYSKTFKMVFVK